MTIPQTIRQDVIVLALQGRLDAVAAPEFKQTVQDGIEQGHHFLVVDFSKATFMDSSGLGALIVSARALRAKEGEIRLACLDNTIRQIMDLTRADKMFDIFDSTDAAVAAFSNRKTP